MIGPEQVQAVLTDPEWTVRVVCAAAAAANALATGITPDGDDSRLPAYTGLSSAFLDRAELARALGEAG